MLDTTVLTEEAPRTYNVFTPTIAVLRNRHTGEATPLRVLYLELDDEPVINHLEENISDIVVVEQAAS